MSSKTRHPDDVVYFAAHLIEAELAKGISVRKLAERWGTVHPNLLNILSHLKGVGKDMQTVLANAAADGSVDELLERAARWRKANPSYLPRLYREKHPAPSSRPLNRSLAWWPSLAEEVGRESPHLLWAIEAAGEQPQGPEPREEKRRAYFDRAVDDVLDMPEEEQQKLENAHRHRFRQSGRVKIPRRDAR